MLPGLGRTARVLMTVDAVGGRLALCHDLGRSSPAARRRAVFAGLGPAPVARPAQRGRAAREPLRWLGAPLDWMAAAEADLDGLADELGDCRQPKRPTFCTSMLPSQARGLAPAVPAVVVSHSCVATWWHAVRGHRAARAGSGSGSASLSGFARADAIVAPSAAMPRLRAAAMAQICRAPSWSNAARGAACGAAKEPIVLAAGRWWDEGKNGRALDAAAAASAWPIIVAGALEGPNGERSAFAHAQPVGQLDGESDAGADRPGRHRVSPSLYEPFGLAALEAAGAGRRWCSREIPDLPRAVGRRGSLRQPDDPPAFACRINGWRAIRSCAATARPARPRRAQRFTPDPQAQTMAGRPMPRALPALRRSRRRG